MQMGADLSRLEVAAIKARQNILKSRSKRGDL